MNSDINALYASQPELMMGDRDYYLDAENESIRTAYKEYLGKIFRLAGVPEADIEKAVAGVMSVETKLAEKNWSSVELRNIPAMYNPTSKADFEKTYDAIDWAEYYKTMGIGDFERIIVTTPSALANANELMKNAPLDDIRYYLAAQYIDAAAGYLSDDFIDASFDFYGRAMSGKQEQKPRWKRAMSVPNSTLGEAVGEMYVAKYFPEKDKARMLEMVRNLQTALSQHIRRHEGQGAGETRGLHREDRLPRQVEGLHDACDRPLEELLGEHRRGQQVVHGRQHRRAGQTRGQGRMAHDPADSQRLLQPHDQ